VSADPRNSLRSLSVVQDRRAASCSAAALEGLRYVNFATRCDYLANSAALS
jgi:hypothetical protein